jgi:hypothetical protein
MMRACLAVLAVCVLPPSASAQPATAESKGAVERAKHAYEVLFTKPVRLSLEPIAPTAGVTAGIGLKPKPWRSGSIFKLLEGRASISSNTYWAVDGSFAWQGVGDKEWRIEPYARFRSMKRLNYFGLGNDSEVDDRADFAMLDRRVGAYAYRRPFGWLALGTRAEAMWPRTAAGQDDELSSIDEKFTVIPGFGLPTNYLYLGTFANVTYPYVRSERPRRGGDYAASVAWFSDMSGTKSSFRRVEIEGQERFTIAGRDRVLTIHGRMSSSVARSGHVVPFYLMDTLGGADNLRGFKEAIIGSDETTSTLRSFESFRFRDAASALIQVEFRQRIYSQMFLSAFFDAGAVASTVRAISDAKFRKGAGVGLNIYKVNALAVRAELSIWGGEGHPRYFTPGRGLAF